MSKPETKKPSPLISEFERDCALAKVSPIAVLESAGVHKSAWARWKSGKVSPQLCNFEAARRQLDQMRGGAA